MPPGSKYLRLLWAFVHRRRMERELEEEMAAHREMMPAGRRRNFGSTLRLREEAADQWGWTWLDQLRQDAAYGLRALRRSPGFALTAVAVLSLGIGVNLAELQVFHALLHRLQVRDVDSLVRLFRVTGSGPSGSFSLPAIGFYRRHNTVLSALIAETDVPGIFHEGDSESLACSLVSGNFFGELGITPAYGRLLDEQDDRLGAASVAVLDYDYWRGRFGGDPGIVSKTIRLNDKPVEVVGVASPRFSGLARQPVQLWLANSQFLYLTGDRRITADFAIERTAMYGRLKSGISLEAAQAQLLALQAELRNEQPQSVDRKESLKVQPAEIAPNPTPAAVLMLATCILLVLLVLLSACANLGNMLLARGLSRQREVAIRLSVGAGRWRLIRQLMTENLLLAAVASGAALFVGRAAAQILLRIIEAPSNLRIVNDWRVVLACAGLGLGSTLAFGLAPAFQTVKRGPAATRARKVLVSVQVAVSCVLLILSSFFTRAVQQRFRTDVTFDYAGMTLVDPAYYLHRYTPAQARQAALDLAARVRHIPGIDAATIATIPPLRRSMIEHVSGQALYLNEVDPSYFATMHVPLVQGRIFGAVEADVVVVSESAARRLWPRQSPLGKSCVIAKRARTVTGVVKDSGVNLMSSPESVEAYLPIDDSWAVYATVLAHSPGSPGQLSGALRPGGTLYGIVPAVITFQQSIDRQIDTLRKTVAVVASLGGIASLLALLGIFGLLAFTVAQRTREIGVRMALGARRLDVMRCVFGQYAMPFGIGAACGVALAAAAAKVVRAILYGFMPFDLVSFGAGLLVFAAVALAASIAPVRKALRVDPASALRYDG